MNLLIYPIFGLTAKEKIMLIFDEDKPENADRFPTKESNDYRFIKIVEGLLADPRKIKFHSYPPEVPNTDYCDIKMDITDEIINDTPLDSVSELDAILKMIADAKRSFSSDKKKRFLENNTSFEKPAKPFVYVGPKPMEEPSEHYNMIHCKYCERKNKENGNS
jgi:hypothetical protein